MDHENDDTRYNRYMKHVKEIDINDFAHPNCIKHTQSPFQWIQVLGNEKLTSNDYLQKIDDYTNQGDLYTYEKFVLYLALAFEYSLLNTFEKAKYFINELEEMLCTMQSNNGCFYSRIKLALEHVLLATKTNIFLLENEKSEEAACLREKCTKLVPVSEMDSVQQAAIHAIKAKFYLSCTTEDELALNHMKEAERLDPACPNWKHWTGKVLRKIRRVKKDIDPFEEMTYFEEAVQLERNAKYLVFLAQAYREKAHHLRQNKDSFPEISNIWNEIDFLIERSCDLYMECVEMNPSSASVCRRVGNGLMSLPKQFAKYNIAKQLLHKAEELSTNPVTFHILGTFYSRYEENQDKAVEYFQKTADNNLVFGFHELMKIKYLNDPEYNPLEDLLKAAKSLEFSSNLVYIEGDLGWYYMVSQNNLTKGLEYFWNIIERNNNSHYMKKFYSYSFLIKGPLNMYKVLKEQILNIEEELRDETMNKFLEKVNDNPELLDDSENCISLKEAQAEALSTLKWQRSKQKQNKEKLNHRENVKSEFYKMSNQDLNNSTSQSQGTRNWRKGSTNDNVTHVPLKAPPPPKQENWRLECRKF